MFNGFFMLKLIAIFTLLESVIVTPARAICEFRGKRYSFYKIFRWNYNSRSAGEVKTWTIICMNFGNPTRVAMTLTESSQWHIYAFGGLTIFSVTRGVLPLITQVYRGSTVILNKCCRLPSQQQPRQLHHCPQVWLLRRGGHGLLHLLPQDSVAKTQRSYGSLFLQRGNPCKPLHASLRFIHSVCTL